MTTLDQYLTAGKVPFTTVNGWETRTSAGSFDPSGLMIHHTGADNTPLSILIDGRAGLSGPLCHIFIDMQQVKAYLISDHGNANHAGMGDLHALGRMHRDEPPQSPPGGDTGGGNQWFYGIEIEGNSPGDFHVGEIYSRHYRLAVNTAAAICMGRSWDPMTRILAHKEWTRRKPVDPHFDMHRFRVDTKRRLHTMSDQLTPDELETAQKHNTGVRAAGSNGGYPKKLIPWYRRYRDEKLEDRLRALESSSSDPADLSDILNRLDNLEQFEEEIRNL